MSARLNTSRQRLGYLSQSLLGKKHLRLSALSRELNAISPLQTLGRGYSITRVAATGEILRSSKQVQAGRRNHNPFDGWGTGIEREPQGKKAVACDRLTCAW